MSRRSLCGSLSSGRSLRFFNKLLVASNRSFESYVRAGPPLASGPAAHRDYYYWF
jgi:hypothetical protein